MEMRQPPANACKSWNYGPVTWAYSTLRISRSSLVRSRCSLPTFPQNLVAHLGDILRNQYPEETARFILGEIGVRHYPQYRNDPVGYARDVLHVTLWEKQVEMLEGLFVPPFR